MRIRNCRFFWVLLLTLFISLGPTISAVSAQDDATPAADDSSSAEGVAGYRDAARLQESVFGPERGSLVHDAEQIAFEPAGIDLQNFYVKIRVVAPFDGEEQLWDAGFVFRQGRDTDWRIAIYSDGRWDLRLGSGDPLDAGEVSGLKIGEGDSNDIELVADGETGYLAVNGDEVAEFDLSRRMITGNLSFGATFINGTFKVGAETPFSRFQVWALDPTDPQAASRAAKSMIEEGRDFADTEDPLEGPVSGELEETVESITIRSLDIEVADFYAKAEVTNPRDGEDDPFDIGFGFRDAGGDTQYRIIFSSNGNWFLKVGIEPALRAENFEGMTTAEGEINVIEIVASGDDLAFAVNGDVIGSADISDLPDAGDVAIGVGFYPDEDVVEGATVEYADFAVWELGNGSAEPTEESEPTEEATEEAEPTEEATEEIEIGEVPDDPEEALDFYLDLTDSLEIVYGPESGQLDHEADSISYANANLDITDFVLHAEFTNPYAASTADWDMGVLFRVGDEPPHLRLIIGSTGDWFLTPSVDDPIQQGTVENLKVRNGQTNAIDVVVVGDVGYFAVNGQFVEELDVSSVSGSGDVAIATSFFEGSFREGASTEYEDYVIWEVTGGSTNGGPVETPENEETPVVEADNSYESPTFGYVVGYSDDWSIADEESDDSGDWLRLTNGVSTVDFTGFESTMTPAECLADEFNYYETADGYTKASPALNTDDEELTGEIEGGVWGAYWFTYTAEGEDPVDYTAYVECRSIEEGDSILRIVQFVEFDSYNDEIKPRAELLAGLVIAGGAEPEEDPTEEPDEDVTPESDVTPEAGGDLVIVNISTTDGDSIAGLATIEENGSRSVVSVLGLAIEDGTIVSVQEGSCSNLSGEAAFELSDLENGVSETTIRISLADLTDGDYVITFSESENELDAPIACGEIEN